jgi:transposase
MASLKEETAMIALTEDTLQTIQSAARLLTGHKRRRFQAETALQYCNGSARQAEKVFGWGRAAVDTGLHELRTGIRCLDAYALRGRKKSEELCPQLIDHIHRLVEPQAQADPKFQTPFAFTRITAKAVRDALQAVPELKDAVPSRQTVGELLHRMGYRLRRVLKTRPEKKFPKPTRFSKTSKRPVPKRQPIPTP